MGKKRKKKRNGTGLGEMNGGRGGGGEPGERDGATEEMERTDMREWVLTDQPSLGVPAYVRGYHWMCLEDSGLGYPLLQGKEGQAMGDHPTQELHPTLGCGSLRLVGRGGKAHYCLPGWLELSPDLL